MNFPPILFNNEKFPSLLSQSHSQTSITINSFQTLCKKLLKYDNKESNFEQGLITWLKSLDISQLFKYFSFKNQWLVDILHEMILISNSKPYIKFKYIPNISSQSSSKEPQDTKLVISYLHFLFSNKESPKFSDYFNIVDEGFVLLSRGKSEGEQRRQELVDNIRYVTLNSGNNNYKDYSNNNEEEKDYHSEYNNVVTLSYHYLKNIDKLITTFQDISNKQCFKYPIEIETQNYYNENDNINNNSSTKKNYYNFKMPKWLKDEFTFPELFCAYLEQCIIINYMYYKMYKSEISFLYYDKFDELIDNNKKLIEFIKNSGDKKFEIIRNLRPDEIKKTISENPNIKKMICNKNTKDNDIMNSYIGKYSYSKKHTMKTVINSCICTLEKIFIRGELDFVLFLNFFKDNIIFSTDDFAIKAIADIVNNYWKSKAAEDLLHDLDNNNNNNNNEGNNNNKKKKKRRKKKKGKHEEDINNNNDKNNNDLENNDNITDNVDNIEKKDNNLNNEDKKSQNNDKDNNEKNNEEEEKKNNEDNIEIITNNNININENNEQNKEEIISEKKEENNINNDKEKQDENNINELKEENINENDNNNNIIENENENEKNHKKKKEKEFFLYPTVKDSNKKKKNKQKGKKNLSQNNEINENTTDNNTQNNNIIIQNIEDDKTDLSTDKATSANTKEEEDKIIQNEIINENNENITEKEKEKDKFKKENHKEYDYNSSKHKNKFNMSINQKQFKKENYKIPSKKYHHHDSNYNHNYNYKYQKNDYNEAQNNYIEQEPNSEQNNYLMGSNLPHFTSFNFQSKKKRNYRNKQQGNNENIFPYNNFMQQNIIKLSKEIYDNTIKVNENKKLLQQIREKYIKKIYENINIILKNSKVEFQCSFYGSSVSGLAIENSDIDIMVKLRKKYEEKDYIIRIMNILVENLKKSDLKYIKVINPITSASVPVIKLNCDLLGENSFNEEMNSLKQNNYLNIFNSSKLYFDITFFETENELEKIPSELMLDYIKECTMLYPQIFDIVYIMKRFLYNRKLNKSYQGGISSYSLFLLTLAFIKSYKSKYDIPIASLFIEYLYFYSNFNFFNTIIQPSKENNIFEKKEYDPRNQCLDIIDPITGLNVAKSTFRIEEIQSAFRNGFDNIIFHLVDLNMDMNMDNIGNINNNINIQEQSKHILEKFFKLSQ